MEQATIFSLLSIEQFTLIPIISVIKIELKLTYVLVALITTNDPSPWPA